MSTTPPSKDASRLEALASYRILGTPPDEEFDRLTGLVADRFDTAFAAMNLMDDARCFFKSFHGADVRELPLYENMPCLVALRSRKTLVLPDALGDAAYRDFPLVEGAPHIRFYATTPIVDGDGFVLGTLFIADTRPRDDLSDHEIRQLEGYAGLAASLLASHRTAGRLATEEGARHALTESVSDVIFGLTPNGEFAYMNPAFSDAMGRDRDEWLGRTFEELVDPEEYDELRRAFERVVNGERIRRDVEVSTPVGVKTFEVIAVPSPGDPSAPVAGVARDLTERARSEVALQKAEARYRAIFDNSVDGVMRTSPEGPILEMNQAMLDMLGYTSEDVLTRGLHRNDVLDLTDPRLPAALEERRRTGTARGEFTYKRADGSTFPVELTSSVYTDPDGSERTVIIVRDVSERVRREKALRESEERFAKTFRASPLPSVVISLDTGRVLAANPAFAKATGYGIDEIEGRSLHDLGVTLDPERATLVLEAMAEHGHVEEYDTPFRTKDGTIRHAELSFERIDVGGEPCLVLLARDVTDQKRAEAEAKQARGFAEALINSLPGAFYVHDGDRFIRWNRNFERITGYDASEIPDLRITDVVAETALLLERVQEVFTKGSTIMEGHLVTKGGKHVPYILTGERVILNGRPYLVGVGIDITEQKRAEDALRTRARQQAAVARLSQFVLSQASFQEVLDEAARIVMDTLDVGLGGVLEAAADGNTLLLRSGVGWGSRSIEGARDLEAHSVADAVLTTQEPLVFEDLEADPRVPRSDLLGGHGVRSGVSAMIFGRDRPFGAIGAFSTERRAFSEDDGNFIRSVANLLSGALEQRLLLDELAARAEHDDLTGLPNRSTLIACLEGAIAEAKVNDTMVAVLFLDLDRFKNINDSLGHQAGDELLKGVAERVSSLLREGDVRARFAGDEFVLMLSGIERKTQVAEVAYRILGAFDEPFPVAGRFITVKATLGICLFPEDAQDAASMLRGADAAMYQGKTVGRNTFQFFTPEMNTRLLERLELESHLRQALHRNEFELHYQPQVNLATREIIGFEALLHWHHPRRGLIPPDRFIPIAEDTGLIVPIGEWVMREAFAQLKAWKDEGAGPVRMAVNIAAPQFTQPGFTTTVRQITQEAGLEPDDVELEITESVVLHDAVLIAKELTVLENFGFRVALDDFGTGYSSLAYLRDLPIDRIKIDRSFTAQIDANQLGGGTAFVEAMIRLAHSLGLEVIAEGIEKEAQVHVLRGLGCAVGQGYLFARPTAAEAIPAGRLRDRY